jgi:hypothetical protein
VKKLLGDNAKNAAADDCADAPLGHRLVTEKRILHFFPSILHLLQKWYYTFFHDILYQLIYCVVNQLL